MKRALLFLTLAAGFVMTACKKDKSPDPAPRPEYSGTPNAISGVWSLDVYWIDAMIYDYGFGTNLLSEKVTGHPDRRETESGAYSLKPIAGTNDYMVELKPDGGVAYSLKVSNLAAQTAVFETNIPYSKSGYRRKPSHD